MTELEAYTTLFFYILVFISLPFIWKLFYSFGQWIAAKVIDFVCKD